MSENRQGGSARPMGGRGPMGGGPGGPGGPGGMTGEKAKDFKGSFRRLLRYLRPFLPGLIFVMFCAAASTIFTILGPDILKNVTNELQRGLTAMITGSGEGIDFDFIGRTLLWLLGIYVLASLFQFFQSYIIAGVSASLSYNLHNDIMRKIQQAAACVL